VNTKAKDFFITFPPHEFLVFTISGIRLLARANVKRHQAADCCEEIIRSGPARMSEQYPSGLVLYDHQLRKHNSALGPFCPERFPANGFGMPPVGPRFPEFPQKT